MPNNLKSVAFYVLGLAGLVLASWLVSVPGDYRPLPTATLPPTATRPLPTPVPTATPDTTCRPTPGAMRYGYLPDSRPTTQLGQPDATLPRLVISGTVYGDDCRTPLPGAAVEVWHTNAQGKYSRSADSPLRGQFTTDLRGRYVFTTTMPGRYVSGIEPLPANIHFRISHPRGQPLFTQLFFARDPFLHRFPFVTPPLIVPLESTSQRTPPTLRGRFDIVLAAASK